MDDDNWRIANDEYDTWKALHKFDDFLHEESAADGGQPIPRKTGWRPRLLIHDEEARFARRLTPIGLLLVLIVTAGVALATVLLFTQSLNPPGGVPFVLVRNCDPAFPNPASVPTGTNGFVTWSCGGTTAAIHVQNTGTVTPTQITKDSAVWTTTYIFKEGAAPTTGCASSVVTKQLSVGVPVTFVTGETGGWDYCSDFVNAPATMTSIVYSWSQ